MAILDSLYNYYEQLVLQELARQMEEENEGGEFLRDVACVALNRLPARYFSHGVDMAFYLEAAELAVMKQQVEVAVKQAVKHIKKGDRR